MQEILDFLAQQWPTVAILVAALVLLARSYMNDSGKNAVGPQQAVRLMNDREAVVLDVREANEFSDGHIRGAIHIPLGEVKNRVSQLQKYKSRPIIVGCRSGSRSNVAAGHLRRAGFEQVFNLRGGMLAWQNANLPVTQR
ncbi:MAG: rhodanese-like domain-containing protein [Chromatiales bacterium]|nr:rhodanese-like domain-containing protein [Chromatiales bacterium]